jgi:hypothetical protein
MDPANILSKEGTTAEEFLSVLEVLIYSTNIILNYIP